jgi:hypothetical protein
MSVVPDGRLDKDTFPVIPELIEQINEKVRL